MLWWVCVVFSKLKKAAILQRWKWGAIQEKGPYSTSKNKSLSRVQHPFKGENILAHVILARQSPRRRRQREPIKITCCLRVPTWFSSCRTSKIPKDGSKMRNMRSDLFLFLSPKRGQQPGDVIPALYHLQPRCLLYLMKENSWGQVCSGEIRTGISLCRPIPTW